MFCQYIPITIFIYIVIGFIRFGYTVQLKDWSAGESLIEALLWPIVFLKFFIVKAFQIIFKGKFK